MPENRGRDHHRNRMAETLREEISILIGGELSDPRIGSATVTEVAMNPGGKSGQVFVSVEGGEADESSTLEGLIAARGYIHSVLLDRLGVKRIPDLTFHIDKSEKINARLDTLLDRMKKREKKNKITVQA